MQNIKDLIIKGLGYGGPYTNFKAVANKSEEILNILIILTFLQYKIHKAFSISETNLNH